MRSPRRQAPSPGVAPDPEVGLDHLLVALGREQQRDVHVDAEEGELLDRSRPGVRGGTLIITFGRPSRRQTASAWSTVPAESSARSGVTWKETKPSAPEVAS